MWPPAQPAPLAFSCAGNGDDQIISEFINGLPLDDNNSYRTGVAGDIDGDGKDEIVIIRENNLRYYPNANTSASAVDYATTTNRRSIAIGDLDKTGGSGSSPIFATNLAKIEATANIGFDKTGQIILKNGNTEDPLPFFVGVDGNPSWLNITTGTGNFGTAPGKSSSGIALTYTIRGSQLAIGQTYQATIRIQSSGAPTASNSPLLIPVVVTAQTPPFEAIPAGASAFFVPCSSANLTPTTLVLTISGQAGSQLRDVQVWDAATLASMANSAGALFLGARDANGDLALANAAGEQALLPATGAMSVQPLTPMSIEAAAALEPAATTALTYTSQVPWITAISVNTTTLPAQLTLEVSPTLRTQPIEVAGLVLIGPSYDPANPIAARSYPITLVCSDNATWLPLTRR
jgi:hypothetical protein